MMENPVPEHNSILMELTVAGDTDNMEKDYHTNLRGGQKSSQEAGRIKKNGKNGTS